MKKIKKCNHLHQDPLNNCITYIYHLVETHFPCISLFLVSLFRHRTTHEDTYRTCNVTLEIRKIKRRRRIQLISGTVLSSPATYNWRGNRAYDCGWLINAQENGDEGNRSRFAKFSIASRKSMRALGIHVICNLTNKRYLCYPSSKNNIM